MYTLIYTVHSYLFYRLEAPPVKDNLFCPIKPSGFHIPSQQSAFTRKNMCPLLKPYVNQSGDMAIKASKPAQDVAASGPQVAT